MEYHLLLIRILLFIYFFLQGSSKFNVNNIVLPTVFSKRVQDAIDKDLLTKPENRLAFIRECVSFFESQLERPTVQEYTAISKKICDVYPAMKNMNHTKYWVC